MDWANGELLRTFRGGLTSKVDFVEYSNKFVVYAGSSTLLIHFYNVYNRHDTVREPAQINMDSPFRGIWLDDTHSSIICWNVNSISKIMLTTNENGHIQTQVSYSNFTAVSYCESAVSVLCAGDEAGAIHLWKLTAKKSEVLTQIFHHSSPISCLSFTPAALLSASCDGDINMFDGISLSLLRSLNRKRRTPHLDADR